MIRGFILFQGYLHESVERNSTTRVWLIPIPLLSALTITPGGDYLLSYSLISRQTALLKLCMESSLRGRKLLIQTIELHLKKYPISCCGSVKFIHSKNIFRNSSFQNCINLKSMELSTSTTRVWLIPIPLLSALTITPGGDYLLSYSLILRQTALLDP